MLSRLAGAMPKSAFVRNVGVLASGTAVAQGITVLSLPLLTRLYSPEDFSLLAVYASVLGLFTVIACLRFNVAIPLPGDDGTAMDLLILSLLGGALIALLITVPIVIAPAGVVAILEQPGIAPYLWMLPLGVFFAASYDALQYWASRRRRFGLITRTRMTRAVGGTGTQVAVGAVVPGAFGLIFGQMILSGLGSVGLAASLWRQDRAALAGATREGLVRTVRRYRDYPLFSVPEALAGTAALELSILIIAANAAGPEAGFLMLALRVIGLPMGLVGASVGQVYLAEAGGKLAAGEFADFTRRAMWTLFRSGAPPLAILGIISPFLFPVIFGAEWGRAGVIVAWLTPMFVLQFIASPVSMAPHVMGRVGWAMGLQAIGAVLRIGAVALAAGTRPDLIVEAFAVSGMLFYVLAIFFTHRLLARDERPCR